MQPTSSGVGPTPPDVMTCEVWHQQESAGGEVLQWRDVMAAQAIVQATGEAGAPGPSPATGRAPSLQWLPRHPR